MDEGSIYCVPVASLQRLGLLCRRGCRAGERANMWEEKPRPSRPEMAPGIIMIHDKDKATFPKQHPGWMIGEQAGLANKLECRAPRDC